MTYRLEYLPVARQDILEIAKYISDILKNPTAAERIVTLIVNKAEALREMPHVNPVHRSIRPLKFDYRKAKVENYIMFYWIDENRKQIQSQE